MMRFESIAGTRGFLALTRPDCKSALVQYVQGRRPVERPNARRHLIENAAEAEEADRVSSFSPAGWATWPSAP